MDCAPGQRRTAHRAELIDQIQRVPGGPRRAPMAGNAPEGDSKDAELHRSVDADSSAAELRFGLTSNSLPERAVHIANQS